MLEDCPSVVRSRLVPDQTTFEKRMVFGLSSVSTICTSRAVLIFSVVVHSRCRQQGEAGIWYQRCSHATLEEIRSKLLLSVSISERIGSSA